MPLMYSDVSQADTSILDRRDSSMSSTTARISSLDSFSPSIFLRMKLTESGFGEYTTSRTSPSLMPYFSIWVSAMSTSPFFRMESDLSTSAIQESFPSMRTRSFSLTPICTQSASWRMTEGSERSTS